jgi:hypothetical protein
MTHLGKPVGDAAALLGNLLEDSGTSVAEDVVVALHLRMFRGSIAYTVEPWQDELAAGTAACI